MQHEPHKFEELDALARNLEKHRDKLRVRLEEIRAERHAVLKKLRRQIRPLVQRVEAARIELDDAIGVHRDLFEKPRTRTVGAIRFGMRRTAQKAALDLPKDEVIALLKQRGEDQLLRKSLSVNLSAAKELDPAEARALGMVIVPAQDETTISHTEIKGCLALDAAYHDLDVLILDV